MMGHGGYDQGDDDDDQAFFDLGDEDMV